jgi:hypothetical protein
MMMMIMMMFDSIVVLRKNREIPDNAGGTD